MKATLDKYLAYIKKQCGITWGDGLKREIWDGEEVWLFWMVESARKEDIYAVELEEVAGSIPAISMISFAFWRFLWGLGNRRTGAESGAGDFPSFRTQPRAPSDICHPRLNTLPLL